jgi:hypothetical protein
LLAINGYYAILLALAGFGYRFSLPHHRVLFLLCAAFWRKARFLDGSGTAPLD